MESGHKRIYYLDFKNLNAEAILTDLKDSPWDSAFVFDDVDDRLYALELILSEVVKKSIFLKNKSSGRKQSSRLGLIRIL